MTNIEPQRLILRRTPREDEVASEASSAILAAIAASAATNRADLARRLELAPSTVTVKVQELMDANILTEVGEGEVTGGRRARILEIVPGTGYVLAAALGRRHARIAALDLAGTQLTARELPLAVADGPSTVLETLSQAWETLLRELPAAPVRATGIALPGPVSAIHGWVDSAAAMPGWQRFEVSAWLAERWGAPSVAENDANAMALGEYTSRLGWRTVGSPRQSVIFLKAGSTIGCGLVLNGHLFRGSTALAGDLAHVRITAAGENPCACGNRGCLETVAGGAAISAELRAIGVPADDTEDVVRLASDSDAQATTRVRAAGRLVGATLASVVNFVNPDAVVLGGLLGTVEPFVAAMRSQLYESCHPLATRNLTIEQSLTGANAGALGVGQLALRRALANL